MAYQVNVGGVLLPVAPDKIDVKVKSKNETVTLIDGAEMDILKTPGLAEISFTAELPGMPGREYAVYEHGYQPPGYYLKELERLATGKQPFALIVARALPDGRSLHNTSAIVSMGDYTITDDAKAGFDTAVKLVFRQYDQKVTYTASMSAALDGTTKVSATRQRVVPPNASVLTTTIVTVAAGTTLWAVAKKYLGDGSRWKELAKHNGLSGNEITEDGKIAVR